MSIDRLSLWQIHVRLIETGSFSAVAKKLATSQPQVGKQIAPRGAACRAPAAALMRKLSLTQESERLYTKARRVVQEVSEVDSQLKGDGQPHGTLCVRARRCLLP